MAHPHPAPRSCLPPTQSSSDRHTQHSQARPGQVPPVAGHAGRQLLPCGQLHVPGLHRFHGGCDQVGLDGRRRGHRARGPDQADGGRGRQGARRRRVDDPNGSAAGQAGASALARTCS
eukprot:4214165-Prymnesium_polylepis.1